PRRYSQSRLTFGIPLGIPKMGKPPQNEKNMWDAKLMPTLLAKFRFWRAVVSRGTMTVRGGIEASQWRFARASVVEVIPAAKTALKAAELTAQMKLEDLTPELVDGVMAQILLQVMATTASTPDMKDSLHSSQPMRVSS
ncbi:unnamed protein product, partial [Sphacelaria rigidula]